MTENEKGKILILKLNGRIFSILINNNRILSIQICSKPDNLSMVGSIYVGKVQTVSHNISAAFVEIQKGETAFLPLKEAKDAVLTNRIPDGTIKAGDELLVQLVKEPVKAKLAGLSTCLSLTGSYIVIEHRQSQTDGKIKISSKLGTKHSHLYKNQDELKKITEKFNMIIRTNAEEAGDVSQVINEAEELAKEMERILDIGNKRTCFSCLHQPEPEYITFVKNSYRYEYDEIITDEKEIYDAFLANSNSTLKDCKIRFYEDELLPLYKLYSIETKISELTAKKVWLKSGAYLIIEQTEALIAIDVNTGKYESRKAPEETYFKINLEAAEEIALQLRARNLAGMILVDFINMSEKEHEEQLMLRMKELLKKDVVPANVVDITGLGLMEITRKKRDKSFAEQLKG
ncbi:MAG: ribonuclease E/G [Lachnospiraceae bacterium]|nr:ribonuclease E/G [Lachnospiraceae bacterium]